MKTTNKKFTAAEFWWVIRWTASLSWKATSAYTIAHFLWEVVAAIFQLASIALLGWAVNQLVAFWGSGDAMQPVFKQLTWILLGWMTLYQVGSHIENFIKQGRQKYVGSFITQTTLHKSTVIDLATMDAAGEDNMLFAREGLEYTACGILGMAFHLVGILCLAVACAVMLFFLDSTAWLLLGSCLGLGIVRYWLRNRRPKSSNEELHKLYARKSYIEWLLKEKPPAKELRLFGLSSRLLGEYEELCKKLGWEPVKAFFCTRSLCFLALNIVIWLVACLFLAHLVHLAIVGHASVGWVLGIGALLPMFLTVQQSIERMVSDVYGSLEGIRAYEKFLATPVTIVGDVTKPSVPQNLGSGIEFRNVSLVYPGKPTPALNGISLTIRPGERVALVGENGSGKTTFVKLLTRLYDPSSGGISVAGRDLREFNVDTWRDRIGVIFQDFMRYHATVAENVAFARYDRRAEEDAIRSAIEKAGGTGMVAKLADGIQTQVGSWYQKGAELSDGQWQRIALARAFFRDSDILILDEPTSVLDARAEHEIFTRFLDLTAGKTTLLISHRFSTVRMADRIVVFKDGAIVESGSHQELMRAKGHYQELFTMQAEGYRLE